MMGPTKLSKIRTDVRKAFRMSDAELLAWFDREMKELGQKPKPNKTEIDSLRLLRDALVKEAKRAAPRRKPLRATGRAKNGRSRG